MKRALFVIASIIVVIGLTALVYILFLKPSASLTVANGNAFGDTGSATTTTPGPAPSNVNSGAGTVVAPNLIEISAEPVAAGTISFDVAPTFGTSTPIVATSTATSTSIENAPPVSTPADVEVRYIDRTSGNVYAYRAIQRSLTRISNKTLPGIQEASWLADGSMAFVQYIDDSSGSESVSTYALPADGENGYFLQSNLSQVSVIGSSTVFTLSSNAQGSTGTIARADGTDPQTLFNSLLSDIFIKQAGSGFIAVTKAAAELDGYAFSVSGSTFSPIIGPYKGLTVLPSPTGSSILYSYTDDNGLHMEVLDMASGATTVLPLATIADKCVWTDDGSSIYCGIPTNPSGTLPDDWYQGAVSFTDKIWRIDLSSRLATLIVDPSQEGKVAIDAVNLSIDPNSRVLVFRNKKDSSLWAYSL